MAKYSSSEPMIECLCCYLVCAVREMKYVVVPPQTRVTHTQLAYSREHFPRCNAILVLANKRTVLSDAWLT